MGDFIRIVKTTDPYFPFMVQYSSDRLRWTSFGRFKTLEGAMPMAEDLEQTFCTIKPPVKVTHILWKSK